MSVLGYIIRRSEETIVHHTASSASSSGRDNDLSDYTNGGVGKGCWCYTTENNKPDGPLHSHSVLGARRRCRRVMASNVPVKTRSVQCQFREVLLLLFSTVVVTTVCVGDRENLGSQMRRFPMM